MTSMEQIAFRPDGTLRHLQAGRGLTEGTWLQDGPALSLIDGGSAFRWELLDVSRGEMTTSAGNVTRWQTSACP